MIRLVGGAVLGVEAVSGIAVEKLARDVGPKLLEDGADAALGSDDEPIAEGLANAGTVRRIVEVGDAASGDVAQYVGVAGLPLACVVVLADDIRSQGIEQPVGGGSVAQAEVAGILVEDGRQDAVTDHGAIEGVEIGRAGALAIAFNAPAESLVLVEGLVIAGNDEGRGEGDGISGRAKSELHLLACGHGDSVTAIGDIEGRQDAHGPLLLLLLDLLVGFFALGFLSVGLLCRG